MRSTFPRACLFLAPLALAHLSPATLAAGPDADATLRAVSEDPAVAAQAVAELRARGQDGLDALLAAHEAALAESFAFGPDPAASRLVAAVDAVAGQRDARFARLFWHTDLDAALAAAKTAGKPVLSLRLLGRLDCEKSCANSRFFRTALYPDPAVAAALRDGFVLHWQTVRPVPVITIDFGDGRVIERTVTGNSAHLVLDAEGRAVDVLPGLYAPGAFLRHLRDARELARGTVALEGRARSERLSAWHGARLEAEAAAHAADLAAVGLPAGKEPDDAGWAKIGALHRADARLSEASRAVMAEKTDALSVQRLTVSKAMVESPLVRLVRRFEADLATDSVRNEHGMHRAVHEWFAKGEVPAGREALGALTERVYADLFLTPASDPWLGLVPKDAYTALDGGGLSNAR